ncbi:MAG: D-aminoacylase [Actinomycetota bacterium]|nr:D-aminoacylase [Actinomycetota bacterium]
MASSLIVRNATIVDGSGGPGFSGDLAVTDARITAVGTIPASSDGPNTVTIDAGGACLSPGFVDVHTHDDRALLRHPGMEFKLSQGCTSLVIGNCGFSAAPAAVGRTDPSGLIGVEPTWTDLDGFRAAVEAVRPSVNSMALIGHNSIRTLVMGEERRAPTVTELDTMRRHVEAAMGQGACGFSTGLIYRPGRWSQTDEVIELARAAAGGGGLYATHMRNEGDRLLTAVDEAIHIGRTAGLPVQISHHKSAGRRNWGRIGASLAKIDAANAEGADITLDVYPYTAGSGPMAQYFDVDNVDPELAEVIRFASCPAIPEYEGRMAVDLAVEEGVSAAAIIEKVLRSPKGDRTVCIQFIIDEADVEENLRHPLVMVGSDGIPDLKGRPHPRLFGTFPKVLAHYVRHRHVLSLEEAVRRMTSLSCDRFGFVDRGRVGEGQFADLVLFDPAAITDTATYDDPKQEATGISLVVVNGQIALRDGTHTGAGAGRFLHHNR